MDMEARVRHGSVALIAVGGSYTNLGMTTQWSCSDEEGPEVFADSKQVFQRRLACTNVAFGTTSAIEAMTQAASPAHGGGAHMKELDQTMLEVGQGRDAEVVEVNHHADEYQLVVQCTGVPWKKCHVDIPKRLLEEVLGSDCEDALREAGAQLLLRGCEGPLGAEPRLVAKDLIAF